MADAPRNPSSDARDASSALPQSHDVCDPCDAPLPVHSINEVTALMEQASHDLRSSLNAIQSWSYVLDRSIDAMAGPAQRALAGMRSGMQQQLAQKGPALSYRDRAGSWTTRTRTRTMEVIL